MSGMEQLKAERTFSTDTRESMASRGVAMPDGSYPIPDKDALRRAIASFGRAKDPAATKAHIIKRARALGAMEMLPEGWRDGGKSFELKAQDLTSKGLAAWLNGEKPRPVLAVPFYGPIPHADGKGRDLEGEYFDYDTDLVGPFRGLAASRSRLVDWHHENRGVSDPRMARIKGTSLGHMELHEEPDEDGLWADWWIRAGEENRKLTQRLIAQGGSLFASSQPVKGATVIDDDGHISVWPLWRMAVTTSPMNRLAVIPDLKAILSGDLPLDDVGLDAMRAFAVGLDALIPTLSGEVLPSDGSPEIPGAAKAGRVLSAANEAALTEAVELLSTVLAKVLKDPEVADALVA